MTSNNPFFSIVIPTYNRSAELRFALYCILHQTYKNLEVIISDNCSDDDTAAVVKEFGDRRIRYSRTEKLLWNSFNIGRGIDLARGKYIFLHSDDDFLLYKQVLKDLHNEIMARKVGVIRLNYLSMSLDRKRVFSYRVHKSFLKNTYLKKESQNDKVISFIRNFDPYFISGIVFKNHYPASVQMVDSDPAPWINILFYNAKKFGAGFIKKHQMVALWSRRKINKRQPHHIFSLYQGKLRAEQYLEAVKLRLSGDRFRNFLHGELYVLYIECFPMIKAKVGNMGLLQLARRILVIAPEIKRRTSFWILLVLSICIPEFLWNIARAVYLWIYAQLAVTNNLSEVVQVIRKREREFLEYFLSKHHLLSRVFNI